MSSNKSIALAICLTVTGCAQTPQNGDESHWWSFGSDKETAAPAAPAPASKDAAKPAPVAAKDAAKPAPTAAAKDVSNAAAAPAVEAKAESGSSWWPFGSSDKADAKAPAAKADAKPVPLAEAVAAATQPAEEDKPWYWPFSSNKAKTAAAPQVKAVPLPDPKITKAWLDDYEPRLRAAIKDSSLTLERRESLLAIIVPIDEAYNPKRPEMLMPKTLGPFTKIAKTVEGDPKTAVLVLGHGDTSSATQPTQELSQKRAQSIAAIFRLSGLQRDRLILRGMGSVMPRAANDSTAGRALNRRVEILLTPQNTMVALLSQYAIPTPAPVAPTLVAAQEAKPAAPAVAAKKAVAPAKGKAAASKKTAAKPAAKKAAAKAPAKKAAAPAKKVADAKAAN